MVRVCHMTGSHFQRDTRILFKECVSLAKAGYEVYLCTWGDDFEYEGVHAIGTGEENNSRRNRLIKRARKIYENALRLDADIYHIHEMEYLPYGVKLARKGKKVIFDSHEDYPILISTNKSIPCRKIVSKLYAAYEKYCLHKFAGVVAVTPHYQERLKNSNENTVLVTNFPILSDEESSERKAYNKDSDSLVFAGMVYPSYNHESIILALQEFTQIHYDVYGQTTDEYLGKLKTLDKNSIMRYHGRIDFSEVHDVLAGARAGFALYSYNQNVGGKLGTYGIIKLFEAMYAGIPVICTDLELWKDIISKYGCGICVKPDDIDAIQKAVRYILDNPNKAEEMGRNGRRAVETEFNWNTQAKTLIELYRKIEAI